MMAGQMDPHKTMCVCKHDGKEVARIPLMATNREARMLRLARRYGRIEIENVPDEDAGMLAALFPPR